MLNIMNRPIIADEVRIRTETGIKIEFKKQNLKD